MRLPESSRIYTKTGKEISKFTIIKNIYKLQMILWKVAPPVKDAEWDGRFIQLERSRLTKLYFQFT